MITLLTAWAGRLPPGAKVPNAGDRFIEDAAVGLFREAAGLDPSEPIKVFCARAPLRARELAAVNRSRALVICGSNVFHRDFWPGYVKLVPNLRRLRVPIAVLGCGWGGEKPEAEYTFRPEARRAIGWIARSFPHFGVRDAATARLIGAQVPEARERLRVTGCPVLFYPNQGRLDARGLAPPPGWNPRRILFSPNERLGLEAHTALFRRLRELFPEAEFVVALNQKSDKFTEHIHDMRSSAFHSLETSEYYSLFERCDFQIGFRLHNHISFLARSKPSLTAEADGRTLGFAETFGLTNLRPEELGGLTRERIAALLEETADRLPAAAAKSWNEMKTVLEAIVRLPEPSPLPFWRRLWPWA